MLNNSNNYNNVNSTKSSDFTILSQIGKGAFGTVYLVNRKIDNKIYALKKIIIEKMKKKEIENSLNEIRILASISHPNIISYKEVFWDDDSNSLNIVMEYADDGDLSKKIFENKRNKITFSEKKIWSFSIQIVEGLKYLHNKRIIHRDLKSANIFLMKNGIVKIGDLNVSKILKTKTSNNLNLTQTGTPFYASPEVWRNEPYSYKSDMWSLGCIIYEMCTNYPPFMGRNMDELYRSVIRGKVNKIDFNIYTIDVWNMIGMLLHVNAEKRPTCEQFLKSRLIKKKINELNYEFLKEEGEFYNENEEEDVNLLRTIKFSNFKNIKDNLPKMKFYEKNAKNVKIKKNENNVINNIINDDDKKSNNIDSFNNYEKLKNELRDFQESNNNRIHKVLQLLENNMSNSNNNNNNVKTVENEYINNRPFSYSKLKKNKKYNFNDKLINESDKINNKNIQTEHYNMNLKSNLYKHYYFHSNNNSKNNKQLMKSNNNNNNNNNNKSIKKVEYERPKSSFNRKNFLISLENNKMKKNKKIINNNNINVNNILYEKYKNNNMILNKNDTNNNNNKIHTYDKNNINNNVNSINKEKKLFPKNRSSRDLKSNNNSIQNNKNKSKDNLQKVKSFKSYKLSKLNNSEQNINKFNLIENNNNNKIINTINNEMNKKKNISDENIIKREIKSRPLTSKNPKNDPIINMLINPMKVGNLNSNLKNINQSIPMNKYLKRNVHNYNIISINAPNENNNNINNIQNNINNNSSNLEKNYNNNNNSQQIINNYYNINMNSQKTPIKVVNIFNNH